MGAHLPDKELEWHLKKPSQRKNWSQSRFELNLDCILILTHIKKDSYKPLTANFHILDTLFNFVGGVVFFAPVHIWLFFVIIAGVSK